jgi:hypothetical protein
VKFTRQKQNPGATIQPVHRNLKVTSRFRSALAFALSLWCAGAGCMMVSYARAAAMGDSDISVTKSTDFSRASSSMASHACCKARHKKSKRNEHLAPSREPSRLSTARGLREVVLPQESRSSNAVSCCPLTSGSFIQSRASSSYDKDSQLNPRNALSFACARSEFSLRAGPSRLINQDRMYLTGCAFLI